MATGADLVRVELQDNGGRYIFGGTKPKPGLDCSGLNYYYMGVLNLAEAHAHRTAEALYEWCRARGTLMTVNQGEMTVGAWGFVKRGRSYVHHVATSMGNGSTIEAANSRDGVGVFKWAGRFDFAGFCPSLERDVPNPVFNPPNPVSTLKQAIDLCRLHTIQRPFQMGDGAGNGLDVGVKLIQAALAASGIVWARPVPRTGEYDQQTDDDVKWYQATRGLAAWGAVNLDTFNAMYPPS